MSGFDWLLSAALLLLPVVIYQRHKSWREYINGTETRAHPLNCPAHTGGQCACEDGDCHE